MEMSHQNHVKKFECDPTVGSLDTNFLSRYSGAFGGMAQTGHRWRVVLIPCNSMETSLRKLEKKFESDPTFESLDTNIFNRYCGLVDGMTPTVHR